MINFNVQPDQADLGSGWISQPCRAFRPPCFSNSEIRTITTLCVKEKDEKAGMAEKSGPDQDISLIMLSVKVKK